MRLPFFEEAMKKYPASHQKLIQFVVNCWMDEFFSNFVIDGKYDGVAQVDMLAWTIVGFVPGTSAALRCSASLNEHVEVKMADAACLLQNYDPFWVTLSAGALFGKLGHGETHAIGMISLHQSQDAKQRFTVLWQHPKVPRQLLEQILRAALEKRFG